MHTHIRGLMVTKGSGFIVSDRALILYSVERLWGGGDVGYS